MRTADGTCGAAILSNQWAVTGEHFHREAVIYKIFSWALLLGS